MKVVQPSVNVKKVKIVKETSGKEPRTICMVKYEKRKSDSSGRETTETKTGIFNVRSMWYDTLRGHVYRAYMTLPKNKDSIDFYLQAARFGGVHHGNNHVFISSQVKRGSQRIMFYGVSNISIQTHYETESRATINLFRTKSDAINAVLSEIKSSTNISVVGSDSLRLNSIPDSLMIRMGFRKISDIVGNGDPMWAGPTEVFSYQYNDEEMNESAKQVINNIASELGHGH